MKVEGADKVEYAFQIKKVRFGYRKTRYRWLEKNWMMLYMVFADVKLLKWVWSKEALVRPKRRW